MKDIQIFNTLCEGGKTVGVVFSKAKYAEGHQKMYTYRIEDAMTAKVGDMAVVERDGEYSFVDIMEVHEESQIDINASYRYKWLVAIVDRTEYLERLRIEDETLADIKHNRIATERKNQKETAMSFVSEDTVSKIKRL